MLVGTEFIFATWSKPNRRTSPQPSYLLYLSLFYILLISVVTEANLYTHSLNQLTLSIFPLYISDLLNLLYHLCGTPCTCTGKPWVFCTHVKRCTRRTFALDLCFGPLNTGKVSWWTIFLVAIVMELGLGEVQWYWEAVTALNMWILTHWDMEMHWDSDEVRHPRTQAYTHHYCSQHSLADHTVPGSVYRGDKKPKGRGSHVGMSMREATVCMYVYLWMLQTWRP